MVTVLSRFVNKAVNPESIDATNVALSGEAAA
jgi:hypothetical protein